MSPATFNCLAQATSLSIDYGGGASESICRAFFSLTWNGSILHLTQLQFLSIRFTDDLKFLNRPSPYKLFCDLLDSHTASSSSSSSSSSSGGIESRQQQPLPTLKSFKLSISSFYSDDWQDADTLRPLNVLQSLTCVELEGFQPRDYHLYALNVAAMICCDVHKLSFCRDEMDEEDEEEDEEEEEEEIEWRKAAEKEEEQADGVDEVEQEEQEEQEDDGEEVKTREEETMGSEAE